MIDTNVNLPNGIEKRVFNQIMKYGERTFLGKVVEFSRPMTNSFLIGWAGYIFDPNKKRYVSMTNFSPFGLFVEDEEKRKGLGKVLLLELFKELRKNKINHITFEGLRSLKNFSPEESNVGFYRKALDYAQLHGLISKYLILENSRRKNQGVYDAEVYL